MNKKFAPDIGVKMSGSGLYSLATKGAKDVIDNMTPLVVEVLNTIPFDPNQGHFTLSDMGCADGGTSLTMIEHAIGAFRQKHAEAPLTVVHTDQPQNDFNALVQNIMGLGLFKSYLEEVTQVFSLMSSASFFQQMLPASSLHLGFSATAMHYLSKKPTNLTQHVHMVGATGNERALFAQQGHQDWRKILCQRAKELVRGGKLVLANFGIDERGQYLGNTGGVNMFDTFYEIWTEFYEAGSITQEEYWAMTFPQYYNTVEEFSAPFVDPNDPVYQAGLRLDHIETKVVPCPFVADFEAHQNAHQFATEYIPTLRSWSESIYFNALDSQRPFVERKALVDDFYETYQTRVRNNPVGHGMDYVHAYMVITKQ